MNTCMFLRFYVNFKHASTKTYIKSREKKLLFTRLQKKALLGMRLGLAFSRIQSAYLSRLVLGFVIVVTQSAVPPLAPREEGASLDDGRTVGGATGGIHHLLALQRLHQVRGVHVAVCVWGGGEGCVCVCVCGGGGCDIVYSEACAFCGEPPKSTFKLMLNKPHPLTQSLYI